MPTLLARVSRAFAPLHFGIRRSWSSRRTTAVRLTSRYLPTFLLTACYLLLTALLRQRRYIDTSYFTLYSPRTNNKRRLIRLLKIGYLPLPVWLLTTHHVLRTTYYSLSTTHYVVLTAYYSLRTTHCVLLTTYYAQESGSSNHPLRGGKYSEFEGTNQSLVSSKLLVVSCK